MAELDEEEVVKGLMTLHRFCCVKLRFFSSEISSISVEQAIIRWCCGKLLPGEIDKWRLLAAYRVSQGLNVQEVVIRERGYMPFVRTADQSLLQRHLRQDLLTNPEYSSYWYEWSAMVQFAAFYYHQKVFAEALSAIQRAQKIELLLTGQLERHTVAAIKRYHLFGLILRDDGDIAAACSVFTSLLSNCKDVLGSDDAFTMMVAKQSSSLWNRRQHSDRLLEQFRQSRDAKVRVWAPEP